MDFSNATLITSNWKNQFLGETTRYKSVQELSIEGMVLNLTNTDGANGILAATALLESGARNWDQIIINGYNFGSGIVDSFSFPEGRDVQTKTYNATIKIPQSGDFSSLSLASGYSGLSYDYFQYLDGFSESSNFNRGIQKEDYSQSIKFSLKGPYTLSGVIAAQAIATSFFNNNYLNNVLGTKYSDNTVKKFYSESYDSINNTFDFARNFEISTGSNLQYSLYRSHTLGFDAGGVSRVTEKADYLGHTTVPFITVSQQALADMSGAYARCNTFFSVYQQNGEASLLSQPIVKSVSNNPFKATLGYTMQFSNSFSVQSNAFWDYTIDINESQGGVFTATEQGNIIGFGHIATPVSPKYNNALNFWQNTVKTGVSGRASSSSYYTPFPLSQSKTMRLVNDSLVLNQIEGKIDYTQKFSNQDSVLSATDIRKALVTISSENTRGLVSYFSVPNYKEIAQIQPNVIPNLTNYSVALNGRSDVSISTYLSKARSYLPVGFGGGSTRSSYGQYTPPSGTVGASGYWSDASYSYNPFDRSFSLNATITSLPTPS